MINMNVHIIDLTVLLGCASIGWHFGDLLGFGVAMFAAGIIMAIAGGTE